MKPLRMLILGYIILVVSFLFNFLETAYFGYNLHAASFGEAVCDLVSYGGLWIGYILMIRGYRK
jgi:uncharacterized membrane protein